jgi:hypothetical protein
MLVRATILLPNVEDILVGALVGMLCALITYGGYELVLNKLNKKEGFITG